MNIKNYLSTVYLQAKKILKNIITHEDHSTEIQIQGLRVMRSLISNPKSTLNVSLDSGIYYVSKDLIFGNIREFGIEIINGKFYYSIDLSPKQVTEIRRFFRNSVEGRIEKENQIVSKKISDGLSNIQDLIDRLENLS